MGQCDLARYKQRQEELEAEYDERLNAASGDTCPQCRKATCPSLRYIPALGRNGICPQESSCRINA